MDKRYQVFVSSTYADLKDERQKVMQALMEMDCIPAGMEIFPAADDEQWAFIKRIIDDCDYYILIIGGRYGSLTDSGISYTEQEYDYAIEKGLKVLAFLHEHPEEISLGKSDVDASLRAKLGNFREKVSAGRLVRFWNHAAELPGFVALSLAKTIKTYPAVGWVRASSVASNELLGDINVLRKENDILRTRVSELDSKPSPESFDLAPLDTEVGLNLAWRKFESRYERYEGYERLVTISWSELFAGLAPDLMEHPNDAIVKKKLTGFLMRKFGVEADIGQTKLNHDDFQTIKIQLKALGLTDLSYLKTTDGSMALFWNLTQKGVQLMTQLRIVKSTATTN